MRISQDTDSWKASGILRRDFRHTLGEPEVERHKGKRKRKPGKPRQRQGNRHRHVFVDVTGTPEDPSRYMWEPWYVSYYSKAYIRRYRNRVKGRRTLLCAEPGCDKSRIKQYS